MKYICVVFWVIIGYIVYRYVNPENRGIIDTSTTERENG